jgi:predicted transcriptional regulator with HTH domain
MLYDIKAELAQHIDTKIINKIFEHHSALKKAFYLQDWEKCLVRGGKLGEAVMKAIYFIRTGKVTRQVQVEAEINEVYKRSDLPESIRLLIPRAIRILYDQRSKRGGAHGSFDPNAMDCAMVVPIADWTVGELVRLYCTAAPDRAMKFVIGITAKSIPYVERIGEDYVVLLKRASARQEIAYILYTRYPDRSRTSELTKWIPNHSSSNVRLSLANMRKAKLVHSDSGGYVLTVLGIKAVEQEITRNSS